MRVQPVQSAQPVLTPMPRRALAAGVLAIAMLALPACNTVEGLGRDIEAAGAALQDAAD